MYKYAQIINDTVHWIMEHEADIDMLYEKYFSKDMQFIDITDRPEIQEGWEYKNGNFAKPELTPEQIQKSLTAAVQNYMDNKVKERGYDNILSAVGYAGDIDPVFDAEGTSCKNWRSIVWRNYINILAEVTAGQREIPTIEELLAGLPELVWPEVIAN